MYEKNAWLLPRGLELGGPKALVRWLYCFRHRRRSRCSRGNSSTRVPRKTPGKRPVDPPIDAWEYGERGNPPARGPLEVGFSLVGLHSAAATTATIGIP